MAGLVLRESRAGVWEPDFQWIIPLAPHQLAASACHHKVQRDKGSGADLLRFDASGQSLGCVPIYDSIN